MRSLLALVPTLLLSLPAAPADLGQHPGLRSLDLDEVEPRRGTIVHVQVGPADDPDRADAIAGELADLTHELESWLDSEILGFAGLPNSGDREPVELVVLLDSGTWDDLRPDRPTPAGAFRDATSGCVVTYDLAWPGSPRSKRLTGLRRALVDALLDAKGQLPPAWLTEGLAQTALGGLGSEQAGPEARRTRLAAELLEGGLDQGFLLPVAELMDAGGSAGLLERVREATVEHREPEAWTRRRLDSLADQAAALFQFLWSDEVRREELAAYLGEVASGGSPGSLASRGLAEAFWDDLLGDLRAADRGFDPRGLVGDGTSEAFASAVDRLGLDELEVGSDDGLDVQDRVAMAMWLAGKGRLVAAGEVLDAGAGDGTVDRHRDAIAALTDLRAAWLAHLAAAEGEGGKLRFRHDGRTVTADVARVGREGVFLAENSRGVERIAIDDLELGELIERMEKADPPFGDSLARAWGHALVGGKYKRSLTSAQKRDKDLAADLEAVAGSLDRGRILAAIAVVTDAATSTDEARLAAAAGLLEDDADDELVQAELWRVEAACEGILEARFAAADPLDLLAVTPERDGDRITLTYDFRQEEQQLDWPAVGSYSPEFVALLPGLSDTKPERELVRKKGLAVSGSQAMQHLLSFAGPMTLTYEFSFERTKTKREATQHAMDFFYGSICDDLGYNHVRTGQFGELDVVDVASSANEHQTHPTPLSYKLGQSYRIELEVTEGGEAVTRLDGDEVFRGSAHGRSDGRVAFLIHTDRVVHLQEVRISGRLAENQAPTRQLYVDSHMRALGFQRQG